MKGFDEWANDLADRIRKRDPNTGSGNDPDVLLEEGDTCPDCRLGAMIYPKVENCSCHIVAPCSRCENQVIECSTCLYSPGKRP